MPVAQQKSSWCGSLKLGEPLANVDQAAPGRTTVASRIKFSPGRQVALFWKACKGIHYFVRGLLLELDSWRYCSVSPTLHPIKFITAKKKNAFCFSSAGYLCFSFKKFELYELATVISWGRLTVFLLLCVDFLFHSFFYCFSYSLDYCWCFCLAIIVESVSICRQWLLTRGLSY